MSERKTFVLDTNVLLHDPKALKRLGDNNIVIPITVISEIDGKKKTMKAAREVTRILNEIRKEASLFGGVVDEETGATIRVELPVKELMQKMPYGLDNDEPDHRILAVAKAEKDKGDCPVVFITKDSNLRIKASAIGIESEDYENDKVSFRDLYTGVVEAGGDIAIGIVKQLIEDEFVPGKIACGESHLRPNQFITYRMPDGEEKAAIWRAEGSRGPGLYPIIEEINENDTWNIKARNVEQQMALNLLIDPSVELVTLIGKAGTGKTLLAMAAGLGSTELEGGYGKVVVSRPVIPMGKDLGFLPGDLDEKLAPWMAPIHDTVEVIVAGSKRGKKFFDDDDDEERRGAKRRPHEELVEFGILEVEALTYIRGRSMPNQFLVVDEAQNLTPHEIKTIVTRAGTGTKVVFTGDPQQIDAPYLDEESNGLSYLVDKFKDQPCAGHVTLFRGERSPLAELAADIL